jgi:bifunctional N-acetylglucosamine-1-phosphate-uridyltransferase/glucosamine-1-phosphate-acetyltransferase GlmU-like protein
LNVVILAAGQGKRMHSDLPKVLHPLAGKPLLGHVLDTARAIGAKKICVVRAWRDCVPPPMRPTRPGRRNRNSAPAMR